MSGDGYYAERDDRLLRYPEARRLDQARTICVSLAGEYARTFAGQVALLTAANLLGRMSRTIALDVPEVSMIAPLPWAGLPLGAVALAQMRDADPHGAYHLRQPSDGDFVLRLGRGPGALVAYGTGWLAHVGQGLSTLSDDNSPNPVGAALAVIAAAAHLGVHGFDAPAPSVGLNAFNWTHDISGQALPSLPLQPSLGSLWTVGTGSVGTAILYFLTLATRDFSAALFDGDEVKRVNITRSPIFLEKDIGGAKAIVTKTYLRSCGVRDIQAEPKALHASPLWASRQSGSPDLLIAAANEHNVRDLIETHFPPLQIYGTTGKNWQASVIRHVPMQTACSCCLFPSATFKRTECATDQSAVTTAGEQVDASLPFLSFAAGLMAAAEILKLQVPNYDATSRAVLYTRPHLRLVRADISRRDGCLCWRRSGNVHTAMIEGTRYFRF